jgi:protein tyrosine/serine phosphatase
MTDRILAFDGVENFRDYGDYASAGGLRLARGRLLRSAHHARASDADLERMAGLGVEVLVDLRRRAEREAQPNRLPQGFRARIIESADEDRGDAPHIVFLKNTDLTEENVRRFMLDTYRGLAFEPRHVELFSGYFQALAKADGAVLIHCAAGKDRTGLLAALTHALLGVHDDDLMADYLLTNDAARLETRAPEIAEVLEKTYGRRPSLAAVHAFLGVEAEFLDAAFAEIRTRHGSLQAYLEEVLDVGPDLHGRIEARLLG